MLNQQAIQQPFGISVFGSAIMRIEPDIASLNFTVSRLEQHPRDAFQQTRDGVQQVRGYLAEAKIEEVQSSRIKLSESFRYDGREQRFEGYRAEVTFHILLHDLDRVEEILSSVVDTGVNNIGSVDLQTSRLKEVRAEARQRAVAAAREKAELYCQAAGVQLGRVVHIEDVNPNQLRGNEGHSTRETPSDDEGPLRAFDPGSIIVGAAVMIAYEFKQS